MTSRLYFLTADVYTPDGSDTSADGDPTLEGHGETHTSGWQSLRWSRTEVYESRDDVKAEEYDASDSHAWPLDVDYTPVGWLIREVSSVLGSVDSVSSYTEPSGNVHATLYAAESDDDPITGVRVMRAMHVDGYSLSALATVERLCGTNWRTYEWCKAWERETGIARTLMSAMGAL